METVTVPQRLNDLAKLLEGVAKPCDVSTVREIGELFKDGDVERRKILLPLYERNLREVLYSADLYVQGSRAYQLLEGVLDVISSQER